MVVASCTHGFDLLVDKGTLSKTQECVLITVGDAVENTGVYILTPVYAVIDGEDEYSMFKNNKYEMDDASFSSEDTREKLIRDITKFLSQMLTDELDVELGIQYRNCMFHALKLQKIKSAACQVRGVQKTKKCSCSEVLLEMARKRFFYAYNFTTCCFRSKIKWL